MSAARKIVDRQTNSFSSLYSRFVLQCVGGSKGLLGFNYQAGSYTPVVTFDLVVIP